MQGYTYSVFSSIAIAIHLIINYNLLAVRGVPTERSKRYRGFLAGVLAYYIADAAWGILAGLGWTAALYVDTILYFLSLVAFVCLWGRFVVAYVGLGKAVARVLDWCGIGLLAFNVVLLAVNFFNGCFFSFGPDGKYLFGDKRYLAFSFLVAFNLLIAAVVAAKAVTSHGTIRRRSLMVALSSIALDVAIVLQVVWPLTPFTSLGCLIVNCFLQVFVISDEQSAKHMSELKKALERARSAEKARRMFFSIVSHDIRTPLNAILGYSELLQDGMKSQAEKDEALKSIRSSGTTLLQLVNDVLDLAKMDAGKMVLAPHPVDLGRLTDEVFASFKMAAREKGIALVNEAGGIPVVMLDGHRFRQILFNLVGNAVKFTSSGSVTVRATYAGGKLDVYVIDTGCGIPPEMISHVLDPFVQALDPSHSADRAGGTGLGLSICRRLVEVMGGELVVQSEPGKGSTFRAHIPGIAQSDAAAPAPAEQKTAALQNLPKHILVIDDSPVNRAVLTAFLRKAGVESIDAAADGGEGLSRLDIAFEEGKAYDFVLTDFWMPNMSGLELVEKIRENPHFHDLPVYAVTADTETEQDERAALFDGILHKPITYAKLVELFAARQ